MTNASSPDRNTETTLSAIYAMVKAYVYRKTETKSGIKWDDFKDKKTKDSKTGKDKLDVPQKYREIREKVCKDAFLKLRACRAREDFVSFFTGTICSVPQYLPGDKYELVARTMLEDERWEEVKALVILALSGLSRT